MTEERVNDKTEHLSRDSGAEIAYLIRHHWDSAMQ